MAQHVTSFVRHCDTCQRVKGRTSAPSGLLQPLPIPSVKFEQWTMDFIGPLPVCQGYTGLFVAVDRFSKLTRLIPCSFGWGDGGLTAPVVASLFFDHVVRHFWHSKVGLARPRRAFRIAFLACTLVFDGDKSHLFIHVPSVNRRVNGKGKQNGYVVCSGCAQGAQRDLGISVTSGRVGDQLNR